MQVISAIESPRGNIVQRHGATHQSERRAVCKISADKERAEVPVKVVQEFAHCVHIGTCDGAAGTQRRR